VDAPEGTDHRLLHALVALRPLVGGALGLGLVEGVGRDRIGERRRGAALVDRGLRALGLQLAEDRCELTDLLLAQIELEGEKAQRAPDPEAAAEFVATATASLVKRVVRPVVAMTVAATPTATTAGAERGGTAFAVLAVTLTSTARAAPAGVPPREHSRMHLYEPPRRGSLAPGGCFRARRKCRDPGAGNPLAHPKHGTRSRACQPRGQPLPMASTRSLVAASGKPAFA
jgi:hypothetical protein